jgi:pyruvate dehydrogenase E1 component alpha subunit
LLSESDIDALEDEIEQEINDAWAAAQADMERLDGPERMFEHHYAELPPYLREQRDGLPASRARED